MVIINLYGDGDFIHEAEAKEGRVYEGRANPNIKLYIIYTCI